MHMCKTQFFAASSALAVLTAAASASTVLYDNFGPGDSYNPGSGWTVSVGPPVNTKWEPGFGFTVSGGDFALTTVDVGIGYVTGTNSVRLHLYDSAGGLPNSVLQTVIVSDFGPFGSLNPPTTADFGGQTILEDGQQYFLVAEAVGPGAWLAWNWNDQGVLGRVFRADEGPWTADNATSPVARVFGELVVVPAPGALALLGLAGLVGVRRRRN
jgi:hypothetical protein